MKWRVSGLVAVGLAWCAAVEAQDSKVPSAGPWTFGTTVGVNLAQSAFSANWAGGDRGSLVWVLTSQASAERQFSSAFNWKNSLDLAYGQTAQQRLDPVTAELRWGSPDKTTDAIAFQSVARWTLGALIDPYAAFSAESQFQDQTDPRGILKFNPIKLKESAGAARQLFKSEDSEGLTRLGFAFRQVLAKTFTDPFGLERRSFTTNDGGVEWQTDITRPMLEKKVLYKGTLLVFQPVFYSESDDLARVDAALRAADPARESVADFWKATDVNFQNLFSAQITKSLGVNLTVQWVYDKFDASALIDLAAAESGDPAVRAAYIAQLDRKVRKAGQFREVLALAITYRVL
jgi:hypothetical protein